MKTIKIKTCKDCPFVNNACCGKKSVCNHPKLMVKFPYSNDRIVNLNEEPPEFCILN